MDDILQTNIFFFITASAVVVLTAFLVTTLVYVFKLVREAREFLKMVKNEGESLVEDLGEFRDNINKEGSMLWNLASFFIGRHKRRAARRKHTRTSSS